MSPTARQVHADRTAPTTATIPAELKSFPSWVVWRYEQRPESEKRNKVAYTPGADRRASTTDIRTWRSFIETVEAHDAGSYGGIGYVFSSGDPFCGIDLDGCRDPESGELDEWAERMVEDLGGYAEASPSGTGVHIILRGRLPEGVRHKVQRDGGGTIEAYSERRFFTVTGWAL